MKRLYTFSFAALLVACTVTPSVKAADCGDIDSCVAIGNIAVLAEDSIADPILRTAQDGAVLFQRYFGSENVPIAIVPGGKITPDLDATLKQAGYEVSLPWISAADKQALVESSIRKQVMKQTKGMPAEQQEAIIKMALAKSLTEGSPDSDMSATEQGALTHELGHMWFIAAFKPEGAEAGGGYGYGGWAPDWLDETAAILLENEALTAQRRKAFKTMPLEDFYPLKEFLSMEHPALKSVQALQEKFDDKEGEDGSRAIILTGEEGQAFLKASGGSDPANFYTQSRGFADYVIEATGNEQVFAELARHLADGKSFENWLAQTKGLPNDMEALDKDWKAHLSSR